MTKTVTLDPAHPWTIEDIVAVASGSAHVRLSSSARERIEQSAKYLRHCIQSGESIYGVTTGYGNSCVVSVPPQLVEELPHNLIRFHGCGLGSCLGEEGARAVMAVRLASFARALSGVRWEVLERLAQLINSGVVPLIPEEGSVGASGDLTPLSYLAALIIGERDALWRGRRISAAEAHRELGLTPLRLQPKESLAFMNGTSAMTALACLAFKRAGYFSRLATRITSLNVLGVRGNKAHFAEKLFSAKPHPGQMQAAAWLRTDLHNYETPRGSRIQDRYSLRCAPQIVGVLADALRWIRESVEIELNSANDNPLIDGEEEAVYHGGQFYGGHIAFAMDSLKSAVASVADALDRQLALLVDPAFNNGLPRDLSGAPEERRPINHGLKAVQIAASAWTAEALKLTMPAMSFSRSTESHNQDKVSMGTIAARDALRVLQLSEQVAAAVLFAAVQAARLRLRSGSLKHTELTGELQTFIGSFSSDYPLLEEDRPLERELRSLVEAIQSERWPLYAESER